MFTLQTVSVCAGLVPHCGVCFLCPPVPEGTESSCTFRRAPDALDCHWVSGSSLLLGTGTRHVAPPLAPARVGSLRVGTKVLFLPESLEHGHGAQYMLVHWTRASLFCPSVLCRHTGLVGQPVAASSLCACTRLLPRCAQD